MYITVRNNDVGKALRILKKKLLQEGISKELRERRHFIGKAEKRRLEEKAGRKRWLKKREQLEQQFVREERNQLRINKNKRRQQNSKRPQNANRPQNSKRPYQPRRPNNDSNRIRKNVSS